jgi:ankyrin repeat protein
MTPLHLAARVGQTAAVELLLAKGADIKAQAPGQGTPLEVAEKAGQKDAAEILRRRAAQK